MKNIQSEQKLIKSSNLINLFLFLWIICPVIIPLILFAIVMLLHFAHLPIGCTWVYGHDSGIWTCDNPKSQLYVLLNYFDGFALISVIAPMILISTPFWWIPAIFTACWFLFLFFKRHVIKKYD